MIGKHTSPSWLRLTAPLTLLVAVTASAGLFVRSIYGRETFSWATQGMAQDFVDLVVVVPALVISSIMARRGSKRALLVLFGVLIYVAYSYVLYSFFMHFGPLFLLYTATLGLSVYALIFGLNSMDREAVVNEISGKAPFKAVGAYLAVFAFLFALLWLKEILGAYASRSIPQQIIDSGLPTNPVHVLDLAILIPAMMMTARKIMKRDAWGIALAAPFLTFSILMGTAILAMIFVMKARGIAASIPMAVIVGAVIFTGLIGLVAFLMPLKGRSGS